MNRRPEVNLLDPVALLARRTGHSILQAQRIFDHELARLPAAGNDPAYRQVLALRRTRDTLLAQQKARSAEDTPATRDLFVA